MTDFKNKNLNYLNELNTNLNNITEEGILLTHFLGSLRNSNFNYQLVDSYRLRQFEIKIRKRMKSINQRLKRAKSITSYSLKLVYVKNTKNFSLIVAEVNANKHYVKPKNLSKQDLAKHRVETYKQNVNKFALLFEPPNKLKTNEKENRFVIGC